MAPTKTCRHVPQALKLQELNRKLKNREAVCCNHCPVKINDNGISNNTSPSWKISNEFWEGLDLCISCGFIGCKTHLLSHTKKVTKHNVSYNLITSDLWCWRCKCAASDEESPDIIKARDDVKGLFESMALKHLRKSTTTNFRDPELTQQPLPVKEKQKKAKKKAYKIKAEESDRLKVPETDQISDTTTILNKKEDCSINTSDRTVRGFINLGNTCYLNAAMQAIITILLEFPNEVALMKQYLYAKSNENFSMLLALLSLYDELLLPSEISSANNSDAINEAPLRITIPKRKKSKGKIHSIQVQQTNSKLRGKNMVSLARLLSALQNKSKQFKGRRQQDAHEALLCVFWGIDDEINPTEKPTTDIDEITDQDPTSATTTQMQRVLVKLDDGNTISLIAPLEATSEAIHELLARQLNMNQENMNIYENRQVDKDKGKYSPHQSSITDLFKGQITSTVTCTHCNAVRSTCEEFYQLSLSIPIEDIFASKSRNVSLVDCLDQFVCPTSLDINSGNGYECDTCSRSENSKEIPQTDTNNSIAESKAPVLRDAVLLSRISKLPKALIIHLKRLTRQKKIDQRIAFDEFIDLAKYFTSDNDNNITSNKYALRSIVAHQGSNRGGHYISFISRPGNAEHNESDVDMDAESIEPRSWFYISDTKVQHASKSSVLQCEAYMLFYTQIDTCT